MHKQSHESSEKYSISVFSAYCKFTAAYHKISYFCVSLNVRKKEARENLIGGKDSLE